MSGYSLVPATTYKRPMCCPVNGLFPCQQIPYYGMIAAECDRKFVKQKHPEVSSASCFPRVSIYSTPPQLVPGLLWMCANLLTVLALTHEKLQQPELRVHRPDRTYILHRPQVREQDLLQRDDLGYPSNASPASCCLCALFVTMIMDTNKLFPFSPASC